MEQLSYTVIVTSPIYGQQGGATALRFSQRLLQKGHQLKAVFFYQEGVSHALATTLPASDESDLHNEWKTLSNNYQIPLLVCSAAAYRRGVISAEDAQQQQLDSFSLGEPFKMAGLAEMSMLSLSSDRVIQL